MGLEYVKDMRLQSAVRGVTNAERKTWSDILLEVRGYGLFVRCAHAHIASYRFRIEAGGKKTQACLSIARGPFIRAKLAKDPLARETRSPRSENPSQCARHVADFRDRT